MRFVRFRGPEWFQQITAIEKHPLRKLKSIGVVGMFREKELDLRLPKRKSSSGLASSNFAFTFNVLEEGKTNKVQVEGNISPNK